MGGRGAGGGGQCGIGGQRVGVGSIGMGVSCGSVELGGSLWGGEG